MYALLSQRTGSPLEVTRRLEAELEADGEKTP